MKKLRKLLPLMLMALMVSMTMVSCLDSNDDEQLSDKEKQNWLMNAAGTYSGKLYWFDKNIDKTKYPKQVDSLVVTTKMSLDNNITIYDFPVKLFFKSLPVTKNYTEQQLAELSADELAKLKRNDEIVKSAEEVGTMDLKMNFSIFTAKNSFLYYYVAPNPVRMTLNFGGASHDIAIAFISMTRGIYSSNKNYIQIYEAAIYDGKDENGKDKLLDGKALYDNNSTGTELQDLIFEFNGEK